MSEAVDRAKQLLKESVADTTELVALARKLKGEQKFDLARRLFRRALQQCSDDGPLRRKITQQLANCTEKDPDLPIERRFADARTIILPALAEAEELARKSADERRKLTDAEINEHQETFGIAGAIYKRWWEADPQPQHLLTALELYEKGYLIGIEPPREKIPDNGYTGINAAFMLDRVAQQEEISDRGLGAVISHRRARAEEIRRKIVEKLSAQPAEKRDWWLLATLAEASLGLREYDDAKRWLAEAAQWKTQLQPWEYETAVKQFASLVRLQTKGGGTAEEFMQSEGWAALKTFVGDDEDGLFTAFSGKVGLALSGGGFRASLFHIGVLARLAEMDMLRHVEVLSCVSGGSIIGAHYYLKLRNLLQEKSDAEIAREDYLALVQEMEKEFMDAIVINPRMRVFSEITTLATRTDRMGELLDETLYGPIARVAKGARPILRDLIICPKGTADFKPKYNNWRRRNKVPILILNATTLNTGHNWQFTASFMGESPNTIDPEIDGNERLRRMYYIDEAPPPHDVMPLGRAVAASAAVPGLFTPIKLSGLYPERDVELVDGGVHDNQGAGGLREQDCTVLLVSDASGQLVSQSHPSRRSVDVVMRSNNTLMARVRELEHKELRARKRAGLLRDFMFVHLKKDLLIEPVNWNQCDLQKESQPRPGAPPDSDKLTQYGVRGDVQNLLSGIRTDLDAFSEAEACALMASGYKMTGWDFPNCITSFRPDPGIDTRWGFLKVHDLIGKAGKADEFLAALKLAGSLLFKGVSLHPMTRWLLRVRRIHLILLVCALLAALCWLISIWPWLLFVFLGLLTILVFCLIRGGLYRITRTFDRVYLQHGSLSNFLRPPPDS
ncbi:MAG: patatin-like phospholipase family protein [Verrucomicrobiota bacterium]|nr:patatin-like phospholipase family protein [Verrucomicrobiota bacterium]